MKAQRRERAVQPAKRCVRSKTLWWRWRTRGNAASEERQRRARIADATAMMAGDVFSLSPRVSTKAYTSHAMDETPQPLWTPPKLWRREVMAVLRISGTHDRPKIKTVDQNTKRRNASLRQSVNANMLPIEKRAGFFLAYGKDPVEARTSAVMFNARESRKSLL